MGRPLAFVLLDVFTDRSFAGNQLAVFPDSAGVPTSAMQSVAQELGFSEVTYVCAPDHPQATHKVRIFTPTTELPFAGHPTVGTAIALAGKEGGSGGAGAGSAFVFEQPIGLVRVEVVGNEDGALKAIVASPKLPERIDLAAAPAEVAAAIGLTPAQLGPLEPRAYTAGVPFTCVAIADLDSLASARLDMAAWAKAFDGAAAPNLYLFTIEDWRSGREVHARMFGPAIGQMEDAATGAAAVALCPALLDIQQLGRGCHGWTIRQGERMGRPSRIGLSADVGENGLEAVSIGGGAVLTGSGEIYLPG